MGVKNIAFDYTAPGVFLFDRYGYLDYVAVINSITYVFISCAIDGYSSNKLSILIYKNENQDIENPNFVFATGFGDSLYGLGASPSDIMYFISGNAVVINIEYEEDSKDECKSYIFNGYNIAEYGKYKLAMSSNAPYNYKYGTGYGTYGGFTRDGLPYTICSGGASSTSTAGCITTPGFAVFLPKDTVFISASHYVHVYNHGIPYEKYDDTQKLKMKKDDILVFPSVYDANGNVVMDCSLVTILN